MQAKLKKKRELEWNHHVSVQRRGENQKETESDTHARMGSRKM